MINRKKYSQIIKGLVIIVILLLPVFLLSKLYFTDNTEAKTIKAEYVGKEACIECHQAEYNDWKGSDHDLAMDFATDSTVLGDFNNAVLIRNGQTHKLYKKDSLFYAFTDGEDGEMHEYQIKYVFGHFPLQDYLVEFPGGRLQTLSLTWNSKDGNWFYMVDSVYKNMGVSHNNWLHWTNQAQNWNSMCADCHSTNLEKNYDLKTDSYHTTWSEIDVSCEACHGPASEHIRWSKLANYAHKDFNNLGLVIKTSGIDNHQYIDNCARCHSRRSIMGDFDAHSKSIYNHINPILPSEPNWHIDGQIKEEDYVYASFTQSKMSMNDVKCNDCHNVHSGKLILEGNKLCLQCHKANDYDTPTHTFHKSYGEKGESLISEAGIKFEVGSGTDCINCHMHGQNFMGVDYRRDHSFRIPRPDLSAKNASPNACNQCHKDKTNEWAANNIETWFGKSRPFQYGEAFLATQNGDFNADKKLQSILTDELYPTNIRSIAITFMSGRPINDSLIINSLYNTDPSIRLSAVTHFNIRSNKDLETIMPLLNDEVKAVRIEVANKLRNIDPSQIPNNYKEPYELAIAEKFTVLEYNSDFPIGKFNLGNHYYSQKDYKLAEKYYLMAIKQDNELYMAKLNLASLYSSISKPLKAEEILQQYVLDRPTDGDALYNYGLILSENKKYKQSLENLVKASNYLTNNSRVDYNIAMLYDFFGEKENAISFLKKAISKDKTNRESYINLFNYYNSNGFTKEAQQLKSSIERL